MDQTDEELIGVIYIAPDQIAFFEGQVRDADVKIVKCDSRQNPEGFQGGLVVNLEKAAASITALLGAVSSQTSERSYYVVLSNSRLKTFKYASSQYFHDERKTITPVEIQAIVQQTRTVATLPLSEHILQAVPETFLVNDMDGIQNPMGLEASRLGVNLTIHTMAFQEFKNVQRAFDISEIEVNGYFPKTIVLPETILTAEEKNQGSVLVDINEDSVQFILFKNNALISSHTINEGGCFVSEKLAQEWRIDLLDATRLKQQFGSLNIAPQFGEELVPLVERGGNKKNLIKRDEFQEVFIQAVYDWMVKLWTQCDEFTQRHNVSFPHYVLSGKEASVDGLVEFIQRRFSRVCRQGMAKRIDASQEVLFNPSNAPALGMFKWVVAHEKDSGVYSAPSNIIQRTLASARDWFMNYF